MNWLRVDQVLDGLFPPRCLFCGAPSGGGPACAGCLGDLARQPLPCHPPGHAPGHREAAPAHWRCGPVLSAFNYEFPVDRLIAAAKFGRRVAVARGLGDLLALRMPELPARPDAVVPVPLHWRREAERGFNQAEEIARALCSARRWPLRPDLCRRVRATAEQSALGAAGRRANLRNAFALRASASLAGCRHVLIVDDVVTTGATAAAIAALFQERGVPELTLWTVARTPEPGR